MMLAWVMGTVRRHPGIAAGTSAGIAVAVALLGSLGAFASTLIDPVSIPYEKLPHWPASRVVAHDGRLVIGTAGTTRGAVLTAEQKAQAAKNKVQNAKPNVQTSGDASASGSASADKSGAQEDGRGGVLQDRKDSGHRRSIRRRDGRDRAGNAPIRSRL